MQTPVGPLQLQLPPEQSIVQLLAVPQSALQEPPGQWNVQSAPFSHLYEQLPAEQVVSQVPPAQVQSFPLQVSWLFVPLPQAATRAMRKKRVRIICETQCLLAPVWLPISGCGSVCAERKDALRFARHRSARLMRSRVTGTARPPMHRLGLDGNQLPRAGIENAHVISPVRWESFVSLHHRSAS